MNYHIRRHMPSQITSSSVCFDIFCYAPIIGIFPIYQPIQRMMPQPILHAAIPTPGLLESKRLCPPTCFHETKGAGSWLVGVEHWKFGICDTESDTNISNHGTEQAMKSVNLGIWRVKWPKNRTCWHQTCPPKTICGKSVHDNFEWGSTPFLSAKTCQCQKSAYGHNKKTSPWEVNLSQWTSPHLPSSTCTLRQVAGVKSWNSCSVTSGFRTMVSSLLAVFTRTRTWSAKLSCRSGAIGCEVWGGHGPITFMFTLIELPEHWCIRGWWGWWVGDVCIDRCPMQTSWLVPAFQLVSWRWMMKTRVSRKQCSIS